MTVASVQNFSKNLWICHSWRVWKDLLTMHMRLLKRSSSHCTERGQKNRTAAAKATAQLVWHSSTSKVIASSSTDKKAKAESFGKRKSCATGVVSVRRANLEGDVRRANLEGRNVEGRERRREWWLRRKCKQTELQESLKRKEVPWVVWVIGLFLTN